MHKQNGDGYTYMF